MKPLPKSLDDVILTNNTIAHVSRLDLIDDPFIQHKQISSTTSKLLKNFHYAKSSKLLYDLLVNYLPFYLSKFIIMKTYKKVDITFSNVPGPKEFLYYCGSKVLDMTPVFTSGFTHTFLGVISYGGHFKVITSIDASLNKNPSDFSKIIENELHEIKQRFENFEEDHYLKQKEK